MSGLYRYFDGYRYDPITATSFNHDLSLYNKNVLGKNITRIVVSPEERPFYEAVARYNTRTRIIVLTKAPEKPGEYAATRAVHNNISALPTRIITTAASEDSDRFYIYKQ